MTKESVSPHDSLNSVTKEDVNPKAVPELNDEVGIGNASKKETLQSPENALQYTKRVLTEGHTFGDALLTVAAAQIGQVLLTMPNALYKTGLTAGLLSALISMLISVWTMYILAALFLERKRDLIKQGNWYNEDGGRTRVSQYHEVIGHHMGTVMKFFAQFCIILSIGGTSVAQIIACSGDTYVVDKSLSKRTWSLIWGGVLMIFAFVPTFRHFRVLNVVALIGTTYTALYIFITAVKQGRSPQAHPGSGPLPPKTVQNFFTGAAVLVNSLGGHSIALEMMDSMRNQKQFLGAFGIGFFWSLMLSIPHSIAVNLAYPTKLANNDNVFGLLPVSTALQAAAWLMVIHQFVAFALYCTPLLYMFEKLCGVHEKPLYIRLPVRLPVALVIYLLGVMLPFYSSSAPLIAFVFPALTFNKVFWHQSKRDQSVYPPIWPFKLYNWRVAMGINWLIAICYLGFWGGAVVYAVKSIVDNANTFGLFAECYQCPANYKSLLK